MTDEHIAINQYIGEVISILIDTNKSFYAKKKPSHLKGEYFKSIWKKEICQDLIKKLKQHRKTLHKLSSKKNIKILNIIEILEKDKRLIERLSSILIGMHAGGLFLPQVELLVSEQTMEMEKEQQSLDALNSLSTPNTTPKNKNKNKDKNNVMLSS